MAPPYSLNVCAAVALPAAFADTAYYDWYVDQVASSRTLLYEAFERLRVIYWKSDANFVLARFPGRASTVASALAAHGVHVRDRSGDYGCADCLRITAGVVEHTQRFLAALEDVL
jgi:histidinol-phosphate aminotransferase